MPGLEAIAAPTHNTPTMPIHDDPQEVEFSSDAPAIPFHGRTISKSEARLRHPTLINQVQNRNARPRTPTVQYVEIFAGVGSMPSAAKAHGGEIAVLTEK